MSHETNKWAQDQKVGGVGPKSTLVCIASFADEDHSCYPGQAKIATITEQSERAVRRHIATLEEDGYLCRSVRMAEHGRGRTSDRFYLHVGDCKHCDQPAKLSARSSTNRTSATDQPDICDRPTGQALAGELLENHQKELPVRRVAAAPFPAKFLRTTAMIEWAMKNAPGVDLDYETHQFADYWRGRQDVKRTDWTASWRTWIRKAHRDLEAKAAKQRPKDGGQFQTMVDQWQTA